MENFDFSQYEDFLRKLDRICSQIKQMHRDQINCEIGCIDCCYSQFFITPLEKAYLLGGFEKLETSVQGQIRNKSVNYLRKLGEIDPKLLKAYEIGSVDYVLSSSEVLESVKLLCPLNFDGRCVLYPYRPVVCRMFGYPIYKMTSEGDFLDVCFKNFRCIEDADEIDSFDGIVLNYNEITMALYEMSSINSPFVTLVSIPRIFTSL